MGHVGLPAYRCAIHAAAPQNKSGIGAARGKSLQMQRFWPPLLTCRPSIAPNRVDGRDKRTAVRHSLCFSCRLLHDEASPLGSALVRLSGRAGVEDEIGLARFKSGRRGPSQQLADGAALHDIGPDQPGEGERAFDNAIGSVSQAQQYEGDERDDDLDARRVLGGSEEWPILRVCLTHLKNSSIAKRRL